MQRTPEKLTTYVYTYWWKEFGIDTFAERTWDGKHAAAQAVATRMAAFADEDRYPTFQLMRIRTSEEVAAHT